MGRLTELRPKCMLEVGGEPILARTLRLLSAATVEEVVLVVGYRDDQVRAFLGSRFAGMRVRYVMNERHSETNTAYSLWLARRFLDRDLFLLEGDIVFDVEALWALRELESGVSGWAAVPVAPGRDEGILLAGLRGSDVARVDLVREPTSRTEAFAHKCAGIQLLDGETARSLADRLDETVRSGGTRVFADLVLGSLLSERPVRLCSLDGARWAEIDDPDDLRAARAAFSAGASDSDVASHAG